jgi:hypothetical protein
VLELLGVGAQAAQAVSWAEAECGPNLGLDVGEEGDSRCKGLQEIQDWSGCD